MYRMRSLSIMLVLSVALAACSTPEPVPKPAPTPVKPPAAIPPPPPLRPPPSPQEPLPTPGLSGKQRIKLAIQLLAKGDAVHARPEIVAFLKEQPTNDLGKSLLDQIDKDPESLLGEKNFSYKIESGETLSILAERYLGDRFKFYALARYNGLEAPNQAEVGQTIKIPGAARHIAEPRKHEQHTRSDEEVIQSRVEPKEEAKPPPSAPPPVPSQDPVKARALRARGLEAMNKGAIQQAVVLLKQALALDPNNGLIRKDLARAERIASGVGAH